MSLDGKYTEASSDIELTPNKMEEPQFQSKKELIFLQLRETEPEWINFNKSGSLI